MAAFSAFVDGTPHPSLHRDSLFLFPVRASRRQPARDTARWLLALSAQSYD
jgi:hypothetical protein